jgi:Protein of unknown function (DUF3500)
MPARDDSDVTEIAAAAGRAGPRVTLLDMVDTDANPGPRREVAARMTEAAAAWLDTLDAEQWAAGTGAIPVDEASDAERRRWFYTPTDHGGLTFHRQRPTQQRAAMRLVSTGLSTPAYVTVATIIGLENVLDHVEGFVAKFGRERGRDPGMYYLRVFGEPGGQTALGLALRRPPRLAEQPGRRRGIGRHDAVLPRRRPGHLAVARRGGQLSTCPGRGPGATSSGRCRMTWRPRPSCSRTRRPTS